MTFGSYKQYDSRWSKKNYNGSSNYSQAACGPTSCANILYAIDASITPLTTGKFMQDNGYAIRNNGTAWNGIPACLKHFGAKEVQNVDVSTSMTKVWELMEKGFVGVFLFRAGTRGNITWTTSGHYLAVTGYKVEGGKHYLRMMDSGGRDHDGWYCYETQMKGLIPRVWLCKVDADKSTYDGSFPAIPSGKIGEAAYNADKKSGDSSGKEVRVRSWYSFGQTHCFSFKDRAKGLKASKLIADACANNKVGYDNTTKAKSLSFRVEAQKHDWDATKIDKKCDTACSQFCLAGVMSTGINVNDYKNSAGLITELKKFPSDFTDHTQKSYLTKADNLYEGDILAKANKHAIMVTQGEHLRKGNSGDEVKKLQKFLNWAGFDCGGADGIFGSNTENAVKAFQKAVGLTASGYFGKPSLAKAKEYKR